MCLRVGPYVRRFMRYFRGGPGSANNQAQSGPRSANVSNEGHRILGGRVQRRRSPDHRRRRSRSRSPDHRQRTAGMDDSEPQGVIDDTGRADTEEDYDVDDEALVEPQQAGLHTLSKEVRDEMRYRIIVENNVEDATSEEHKRLYRLVALRKYDPLMPAYWAMDFPTLPRYLFTGDYGRAVVNSQCGKDFRAVKALGDLIAVGKAARGKVAVRVDPGHLIKKGVERYIKWAAKDGGFDRKSHIPVVAVECPTWHQISTLNDDEMGVEMVAKLTRTFARLAQEYQDTYQFVSEGAAVSDDDSSSSTVSSAAASAAGTTRSSSSPVPSIEFIDEGDLDAIPSSQHRRRRSSPSASAHPHGLPTKKKIFVGRPPILYGIIVTYTTIMIVTYDTAAPDPEPVLVTHASYHRYGLDVWNALAIATTVCVARDYVMRLDEEIVRGGLDWEDPDEEEEEDVDA